jgi:hypothetical protein
MMQILSSNLSGIIMALNYIEYLSFLEKVGTTNREKILESLANPKISFGFVVVFHFE